jgi:Predicted Zn-dependent peptidases
MYISALENGLTIACQPVSTVETAALCLSIPIGARHDPANKVGLSHFLEHMFFKGTAHHDAKAIAQKIEACGGYLNAYTSRESTVFFARCLREDSEHMLDILSDILHYSTFPETELIKERNVVLQELSMTHDNPEDLIFDLSQATAFQNQGLGRSILGDEQTIKGFTRSDLLTYLESSYRARDMIFCGTGNLAESSFKGLAQQYLGTLKTGERLLSTAKARYTGGFYAQEKALEQDHIILGFEGAPYGCDDYYTLAVLGTLLGGGLSSRLFQKIREDLGLAYSIYAYHTAFMDSGFFGIYASMAPEHSTEVIFRAYEELYRLEATVEEQELNRAKQQLKASIMMSLESVSGQCEQLVHQLRIYGRALSREEILDRIDSVTLEDIKAKVQTLYQSPYTCAALGPQLGALQPTLEKCRSFKAA